MAQVTVTARSLVFPGEVVSLTREGAVLHFTEESPSLYEGESMSVLSPEGTRTGKVIFREVLPEAQRLHVRFRN